MHGAYYIRTMQAGNKSLVTKKLADMVGSSAVEVAITRNTTESRIEVVN